MSTTTKELIIVDTLEQALKDGLVEAERIQGYSLITDDLERYAKELQVRIKNDEPTRKGVEKLANFFSSRKPLDIVILLYGALQEQCLLADYAPCNNILYLRTDWSHTHRYSILKPYLIGNTGRNQNVSERDVLVFEVNAFSGNSLIEARDRLLGQGYQKEKIYIFLAAGYEGSRGAQLQKATEMLIK